MTTPKTNICMVLDRSGSMDSCRMATIESVNKYLLEVRQDENMKDADFELTTFDTNSIDTIRSGTPANVKDLTVGDYEPRGGTPLYDAIGRGIDGLDIKINGSGKAVLVIVTDGQENASRKYNHSAISELIKARQASGWLVVFLGAGLDSAYQGMQLGINAGMVANIGTSPADMANVAHSLYANTQSYAATKTMAEACRVSANASFSAGERKLMGDLSGGANLLGAKAKTKPVTPPVAAQKQPKGDTWSDKDRDAWA